MGIKNVRNFWLDVDVDHGRKVATGPKSRADGFTQVVYVRENGESVVGLRIVGRVTGEGKLRLGVYSATGFIQELEFVP